MNDPINYKGDERETNNFKIYLVLITIFFCRFGRIKCDMVVNQNHFHIMTRDSVIHMSLILGHQFYALHLHQCYICRRDVYELHKLP